MESYVRIIALFLLCSGRVMCNDCPTSIKDDSVLQECMAQFATFFTSGVKSADQDDQDSMLKLICSDEGKAAFGCVLNYLTKCPDILKQKDGSNPLENLKIMTGIDYSKFLTEGGLDGTCAMLIGPCSKVKECYQIMPARKKRETGMMNNVLHYQMFVQQAQQMCVDMKNQISCMIEKLEDCPASVVAQVEKEFENAIKMSMPDMRGTVTFKATGLFVKEECPFYTRKVKSQIDCMQQAFILDKDFSDCVDNVTKIYEASSSCKVYNGNSMCVNKYLNATCGSDVDEFLIRNAHFVYPGIPDDCATKFVGAGNIVNLSFGMLLISLLISMFKNV